MFFDSSPARRRTVGTIGLSETFDATGSLFWGYRATYNGQTITGFGFASMATGTMGARLRSWLSCFMPLIAEFRGFKAGRSYPLTRSTRNLRVRPAMQRPNRQPGLCSERPPYFWAAYGGSRATDSLTFSLPRLTFDRGRPAAKIGAMDLSYPIGRCEWPESVSPELRNRSIEVLAAAPAGFRAAVQDLDDGQLDTPYRPGGWTSRQVVHHVADSHMNSFIRCRLALTEEEPTIKPYDEKKWAELADAREPVEPSLRLIEGLHQRWVALFRTLSPENLGRKFRHPEMGQSLRLDTCLAAYAWHCRHHTAHITSLRERMGWK